MPPVPRACSEPTVPPSAPFCRAGFSLMPLRNVSLLLNGARSGVNVFSVKFVSVPVGQNRLFRVPFGVYEVLVMNPREGQTGRVSRMVINENQQGIHPLEVVLRGTSTPAEQKTLRAELLNRAETYLYVWTR
jgi:hypothetical protein